MLQAQPGSTLLSALPGMAFQYYAGHAFYLEAAPYLSSQASCVCLEVLTEELNRNSSDEVKRIIRSVSGDGEELDYLTIGEVLRVVRRLRNKNHWDAQEKMAADAIQWAFQKMCNWVTQEQARQQA